MQASVNFHASQRDNRAFEKEIEPYMGQLQKYCFSLSKTTWDGEDLVQETLVKAFRKWQQQPQTISKGYLFRIASNTWIDNFRTRQPDIDANIDMTMIPGAECQDRSTIEAAMEMLLNVLTPKQRVALLLTEVFNYTNQEVASMIGCQEGSVRAVCHRARKRLRSIQSRDDETSVQDNDVKPYVHAFYSGMPEHFATLYKQEIGEIKASMAVKGTAQKRRYYGPQFAGSMVSGTEVFYCLLPIVLSNGQLFYIPFYRSEINALLAWFEESQQTAAYCA